MKFFLVCVHVIVLLLSAKASAKETNKSPLELRISSNAANRLIGVGGSGSERDLLFAVITNVSDTPVRIWDQWNSWGYHNLTFTLRTQNSNVKRELKRFGGRIWNANADVPIELGPQENYVFAVWLKQEDRKLFTNAWGPLTVRNGDHPWVELQAHFETKPDRSSQLKKVWTGRISSPPVKLRLADETGQRGAVGEITE